MSNTTLFLALNARGDEVTNLQESLSKSGYIVPDDEFKDKVFGVGTRDALLRLQAKHELPRSGIFDDATQAALANAIAEANMPQNRVEGRIYFDNGAPAGKVTLRLYHRGFGGKATRLGEIKTDNRGYYHLSYDAGGKAVNLEVRAVAADGQETSLSTTKFGADKHEILNLIAPRDLQPPLGSEYQRLTTDLLPEIGSLNNLINIRENEQRQDLTILRRATGWDARLIALAATTAKLGADAEIGIPQQALYALARVGLPTDKQRLARVAVEVVEKALDKANKAGIVSLTGDEIAQAKAAFDQFSKKTRRAAKAPGALSSFDELLNKAGWLSAQERADFAEISLAHRGTPAELWQKVRDKGFTEKKIDGLRLQGKLAALTLNNAELVSSLQAKIGSSDQLAKLVEQGYYQAKTWRALIQDIATKSNQPVVKLLPPAYTGKPIDRLDAYTADLARKVRLSYPMGVVGQMIESKEFNLGKQHDQLKKPVQTFLKNASNLGFSLGRTPVDAFIEQHKDQVFKGITDPAVIESVKKTTKTLTRLYQITPSDESFKALNKLGFTSAQDVLAFSYDSFLDRFTDPALKHEAQLVYRKAQQVDAVTLNVIATAKLLHSMPSLHVTSPSERRNDEIIEIINKHPTLEGLFGSLDFCECEHCRSVFSPAAYFVDLLAFLDYDFLVWDDFLKKHPDYAANNFKKPYDALIERRLDLPHLPLTCENTNTVLPYIDIVNEILEFYVVHKKLTSKAVHDTGDATTPELLAEPQNILPDAYTPLKEAKYPLALPFDLWLETVRRFFDHFETPLWQVLETLSTSDDLFIESFGNSEIYDRAAIFAEYLGISPSEYAILTDSFIHAKWHSLYGFDDPNEALEELKSAKTLARRLGVSYLELDDITRMNFVNPEQIDLLGDTPGQSNFDQTNIKADALVLLKINLFVRLWKKLGWTMEETDQALLVFVPKGSLPLTATKLGEALKTALLYLAHLKTLNEKLDAGSNSRLKLLTLWSDLPKSLYAQLFLTRSVLKNNPVFGEDILNKDHLLTLQGALNLTADEIGRILADAKQDLATAKLTMENISLLYRYGLFARALQLSVRDLIALKGLSELDPFKQLETIPLSNYLLVDAHTGLITDHHPALVDPLIKRISGLDADYPFSQTLRFVDVVEKIKDSGFQVEDLDYLLRHRFDPIGKYRENPDTLLGLVKALAIDIRRVQTEYAVPDDPMTLTDEALRSLLLLALPAEVAETFFSMWKNMMEYGTDSHSGEQMAEIIKARSYFNEHLSAFFQDKDFNVLIAAIPASAIISSDEKEEQIRSKRALLANAFLPYLQQKFVRQSVLQILTTQLNAEPALVEALLTDPSLLADPRQATKPLKPLREAFAVAGEQGVNATFFAATDGTGNPLQSVIAATADTNAPAKPTETHSVRFEGYFEVPAAGSYEFCVVFDKKGAGAKLCLDLLPEPLVQDNATKDGAEINQSVELKAGVLYRFTLEANHLDAGNVKLLVRGEGLSKGPLNRLPLTPATTIERIRRAWVLLTKALQLSQGLGLNERELRYLLAHPADFDGLDLRPLPTHETDDATLLFEQFLRLADYARLKREIAGGTDDLLDLFAEARRFYPIAANLTGDAKQKVESDYRESHFNGLCTRLAELARREVETVRAAAEHLGFEPTPKSIANQLLVEARDFAQEKGIWRLWEVLQVVEKLGAPVQSIARWATPEPNDAIARDLRNTVKARYQPENWQRLVQPIFDQLRQQQRDALVAYIIHNPPEGREFDSVNQLFEYFLIDPGMEPVVQTSRLRLAISSVQLFVQRCLLNLEPQVPPYAIIDVERWQWMKRYRVWEANRKIFLYPENWLEPEFRDDKTYLFRELEGALLQGDVSNDLVEDAFFRYLNQLEEIAQLDIVTMYCEERLGDSNVLHVIGRTTGASPKYFYRRYAGQMWTPWEPVTADIQGDHVVAAFWRDRLHLFWVTFLEKPRKDSMAEVKSSDANLADLKLGELTTKLSTVSEKKMVEVRLHWCEYFQGQWMPSESSGVIHEQNVASYFRGGLIVIPSLENGEDLAIRFALYVIGGSNISIQMTSKNKPPKIIVDLQESFWYLTNFDLIDKKLSLIGFIRRIGIDEYIKNENIKIDISQPILNKVGDYSIIQCINLGKLPADPKSFTISKEYIIESYNRQFFFTDDKYTFFVEPNLSETPFYDLELANQPSGDDTSTPIDNTTPIEANRDEMENEKEIQQSPIPIGPGDPMHRQISQHARFILKTYKDDIINPETAIQFHESVIGFDGRLESTMQATGASTTLE